MVFRLDSMRTCLIQFETVSREEGGWRRGGSDEPSSWRDSRRDDFDRDDRRERRDVRDRRDDRDRDREREHRPPQRETDDGEAVVYLVYHTVT